MNYFVDTHTHLYVKQFDKDRKETIERSLEAEVKRLFLPNIDHSSIDDMLELEAAFPQNCHAMMGLHPCSVDKHFERSLYEVEDWLNRRKFAAVGEIGTDLYWDKTHFAEQQEAFRIQAKLAIKHDLPIVIHCRDSFAETVALIEELQHEKLRGIFHCFSGTLDEAKQAIELGFLLGIGGVATFKNGGLDKVLPHIDLAHLVLETDSPYLAPVPYRGKRNESAYIPIIAQRLAELTNKPLEEVQAKTTENALNLFATVSV